jgi:hypothetical protein
VSPNDLAWPCHNVVPGMAPVAVVLARTEETAVAVTGIRAYPTGFGFTLNLRLGTSIRGRGGDSGRSRSSARTPSPACGRRAVSHRRGSRSTARPCSGRPTPR